MLRRDFSSVPVVWTPSESSGKSTKNFCRHISEKYHAKIDNFKDLHQWSIENIPTFWEELWILFGVIHSAPYDLVVDMTAKMSDLPVWFPGARLNIAENLLKCRDESIAIIATGEDRATVKYTRSDLYKQACRYGAAFRKLGLKKNDHVTCYMSNREECIFAMLGAQSIGAIWSGALPLYGSKVVLNRFKQIKPKFLFTIDKFMQDGKEVHMLEKITEISQDLPSLVKVVVVSSRSCAKESDLKNIRNGCSLDEFLSYGVNNDGSVPDLMFEQLPFDHPVVANYTSGTTGNPKAVIHGFGGFLGCCRDFWLLHKDDDPSVHFSVSPVGWASWNILTYVIGMGHSLVVYEGVPFFKYPTSIYDIIDEFGVTNILMVPSVLDELEKRNYIPSAKNHLSSLREVLSGGSVVKPINVKFVYNKIKKDIMFKSLYGFTETFGFLITANETLPIYENEVPYPCLGVNTVCYDETGKSINGDIGEIVVRNHTPNLPLGLWQDDNKEQIMEIYFRKYPGVFSSGDYGIVNPFTKGFIICGRSDDTLKPRGCRFGSSEIYNIVNTFPEILDSLCVSQFNDQKEERAVLFVKMKPNEQLTNALLKKIRIAIEKELTKRHVPEVILEIGDIPVNLNGKKMEITVKKIINKFDYNPDVVLNKECLKQYENIPELQDF